MVFLSYKSKGAFIIDALEGIAVSLILFIILREFDISESFFFAFTPQMANNILFAQYLVASLSVVLGIMTFVTFAFYNPTFTQKRNLWMYGLFAQLLFMCYVTAIVAINGLFIFALATALTIHTPLEDSLALLSATLLFVLCGKLLVISPYKAGKFFLCGIFESSTKLLKKVGV